MRDGRRFVVAAMLVVVLLGTFVHYGADGPRRSYPSPGSIDANYDSHVGEEAFLLATVTEVSETGVVTHKKLD